MHESRQLSERSIEAACLAKRVRVERDQGVESRPSLVETLYSIRVIAHELLDVTRFESSAARRSSMVAFAGSNPSVLLAAQARAADIPKIPSVTRSNVLIHDARASDGGRASNGPPDRSI